MPLSRGHRSGATREEMDGFVAVAPLRKRFAFVAGNDGNYFAAPPLLSKNTPCSPNMFQTHQGRFSGTGRP